MKMGLTEQLMLKRLQDLGVVTTKYVKEFGPMTKQFMIYTLQRKMGFIDFDAMRNKYPNMTDQEIQFILDKQHLSLVLKEFVGNNARETDDFDQLAEFIILLSIEAADDVYLFNRIINQGEMTFDPPEKEDK